MLWLTTVVGSVAYVGGKISHMPRMTTPSPPVYAGVNDLEQVGLRVSGDVVAQADPRERLLTNFGERYRKTRSVPTKKI